MDATTRWRELLERRDAEVPLDEAALLIAAHADPTLDVAKELARLDDLASRADEDSTEGVRRLLFDKERLRGNRKHYDDPRNSFLDQVLDRRLGIPISLSVLLIEVGRRCGLTLEGVGMPGHFLVRDTASPDLLIDAFAGGQRLDHAACQRLLQAIGGPSITLVPTMLAPTGHRATLARMLANLDHIYRGRADVRSLLWVTRLRVSIPELSVAERASLANGLADLGCYSEAADLLDDLAADTAFDDEIVDRLRTRSTAVRARLN
ncbi:MAG TPA: transglutaminase-like domain-containing protein [Acidimicrobiales bacterium]|jgi:regulator of sirC expression with transglutaminase-like and TPR domain|nr:transglutaminase-like domain-containing protein [Acidimicrobiales bacterium]